MIDSTRIADSVELAVNQLASERGAKFQASIADVTEAIERANHGSDTPSRSTVYRRLIEVAKQGRFKMWHSGSRRAPFWFQVTETTHLVPAPANEEQPEELAKLLSFAERFRAVIRERDELKERCLLLETQNIALKTAIQRLDKAV